MIAPARNRFLVEVARRVASAIGAGRLGVRISPYGTFNDMAPREDATSAYTDLARSLRGIAYLHVVRSAHPRFVETVRAVREAFAGPLILNGGYDREQAEAALVGGEAELISMGRPFIVNPDLVARLARRAPLAEADPSTFYTPGARGYTDYPALSPA